MTRPALKIIDCEGVREDERDRLLLTLAEDPEWTWPKIARRLCISELAARSRYERIIRDLQQSEGA